MNSEHGTQSESQIRSRELVLPPARYPFKAWRIGRLLLTWCNQGHGAPIVDSCTSRDAEGNVYKGKSILLKPWRKNKWGEHLPQPAMVIAWRRHNDLFRRPARIVKKPNETGSK